MKAPYYIVIGRVKWPKGIDADEGSTYFGKMSKIVGKRAVERDFSFSNRAAYSISYWRFKREAEAKRAILALRKRGISATGKVVGGSMPRRKR